MLTMGDNFYDCSKREAFAREFEILKREMMEVVPLPWYFILGNHDVKGTGAELHTKEFHAKVCACTARALAQPESLTLARLTYALTNTVYAHTHSFMHTQNHAGSARGTRSVRSRQDCLALQQLRRSYELSMVGGMLSMPQ